MQLTTYTGTSAKMEYFKLNDKKNVIYFSFFLLQGHILKPEVPVLKKENLELFRSLDI